MGVDPTVHFPHYQRHAPAPSSPSSRPSKRPREDIQSVVNGRNGKSKRAKERQDDGLVGAIMVDDADEPEYVDDSDSDEYGLLLNGQRGRGGQGDMNRFASVSEDEEAFFNAPASTAAGIKSDTRLSAVKAVNEAHKAHPVEADAESRYGIKKGEKIYKSERSKRRKAKKEMRGDSDYSDQSDDNSVDSHSDDSAGSSVVAISPPKGRPPAKRARVDAAKKKAFWQAKGQVTEVFDSSDSD